MKNEKFDLNDIHSEPSDVQLGELMTAVADEAHKRAELAKTALMQRLRDDIVVASTLHAHTVK